MHLHPFCFARSRRLLVAALLSWTAVACGDDAPAETADTNAAPDIEADTSEADTTSDPDVADDTSMLEDTSASVDTVPAEPLVPPLLSGSPLIIGPAPQLGDIKVQPAIAYGADGHLAIAWTGKAGDELGIFFGLYEPTTLRPAVDDFLLSVLEAGHNEPTMCQQDDGSFVVAWSTDNGEFPDNLSVRFRRVGADGTPADADDNVVETDRDGNHWLAKVACTPGGGFAIAGVRAGGTSPGFEAFAQRYSTLGEPIGTPVVPRSDATVGQLFPSISAIAGELLVVWEDALGTPDAAVDVAYGARIGADGAVGELFEVAGPAEGLAVQAPIVATDPESQAAVVGAVVGANLRLRTWPSDGGAGQPITMPELAGTITTSSAVVPVGDGRFALAYLRGTGADVDLRLGYLNASGFEGQPVTVATGRFPSAYRPALSYADGRLALAWSESLGDGMFRVQVAVFDEQP